MDQKRIDWEQYSPCWSPHCLQQGNTVIQGLCSVIALGEHVGKLLKPARGSGSHASLVLNSWQCERACVLHLNTLQADRWWVTASLWSMRGISLARCFELPSIRNNKESHCLSGDKGGSKPHRFYSHVRPCHLSRLSFLCYRKLWGLFGSHSVFLIGIITMPKAQLNSQNGEKRSLLVCEHQDVFCATSDSAGLAPDAVTHSSLWCCLMIKSDSFLFYFFFEECDWIGTQPHLSQAKSPPFSSPISNILPHLNLMKHLSSAQSNKLQEIGIFYVQRWHKRL